MGKSRKRQQRDSDDDDYHGPHDDDYPDMSQKAQRQEVDVAETPVPPRPPRTSPHVHNALNGPLGDVGIAGAGPLEPLAVSVMPTRIATAVLARRFEEKFESSDATECKKAMGKCLAVRPDGEWKLHDAVLDKEMRAFDNMRDRFRHAARYGRLWAARRARARRRWSWWRGPRNGRRVMLRLEASHSPILGLPQQLHCPCQRRRQS